MKTHTSKIWFGLFVQLFIFAAIIGSNHTVAVAETGPAVCQKEVSSAILRTTEIKTGTGKTATNGKKVKVHYTGCLLNGTKFDSSFDHGSGGFEFILGQGQVIKGWDRGVLGMRVGGKRKLVIPASQAYGRSGAGTIPPNSPLVFHIELLEAN